APRRTFLRRVKRKLFRNGPFANVSSATRGGRNPMFLVVKGLLTPPEVARLNALAKELKFVEGRLSNPANQTKVNMQADLGDPRYGESAQIVSQAFHRSREFRDFVFPKRIAAPLLTRYEPGMKYGAHADAAVMALPNGLLRSDVSCTVFISDPSTYEG